MTRGSLSYRAATGVAPYNNSWNWNLHYRFAASYITGSHAFKVGFNNAYGHHENTTYSSPAAPIVYNFTAMSPTGITYRLTPRTVKVNVDHDLGLFAQDKWTIARWTLAGAIRWDSFANSFPEQGLTGTFFGRSLNVTFPDQDNLSWNDITPRLSATYDVFGNGKTAWKISLNKYLEGLGTTGFGAAQVTDAPNPILRLQTDSSRPWGDADLDFNPDCDLNNFNANGECGALIAAGTFGTLIPGSKLRSRPHDRLGQARLQLGVHDQRPAGAPAARVAGRSVCAPVVRQHPRDGRQVRHGRRLQHLQPSPSRRTSAAAP